MLCIFFVRDDEVVINCPLAIANTEHRLCTYDIATVCKDDVNIN